MDAEEWIVEELRARNNEILVTQGSLDRLVHFTLVLLGATLVFLGSSTYRGAGDWAPSIFFGATTLFASLACRFLFYLWMDGTISHYIQHRLVPRLEGIYTNSGDPIYGWEEYIWKQKRARFLQFAGPFTEVGVFALPVCGFLGYGILKLINWSDPSMIQTVATYILLGLCVWSVVGAISIGAKARKLLLGLGSLGTHCSCLPGCSKRRLIRRDD
jgi:hypothetical protein